jgi:hypothetical protein
MAKQSCCHKKRLRRGLWSPEEDDKLMNHIAKYGHGCWSSVPKLAGKRQSGRRMKNNCIAKFCPLDLNFVGRIIQDLRGVARAAG